MTTKRFTKADRSAYAAWLGRRSYEARVERLGLKRIQEIARANGRKGGRPKKEGGDAPSKKT